MPRSTMRSAWARTSPCGRPAGKEMSAGSTAMRTGIRKVSLGVSYSSRTPVTLPIRTPRSSTGEPAPRPRTGPSK